MKYKDKIQCKKSGGGGGALRAAARQNINCAVPASPAQSSHKWGGETELSTEIINLACQPASPHEI